MTYKLGPHRQHSYNSVNYKNMIVYTVEGIFNMVSHVTTPAIEDIFNHK